MVSDSRDAFLQSRNWNFPEFVLPCTPVLRKRGSAELINLTDGWKSMDTLSVHVKKVKIFGVTLCKGYERPIGYGTAFSKDDLDDDDYSYAGSRSTNPKASDKADSDDGIANGFDPAPYSIGGGAIPAFHELSKSALKQDDPRTQIAIRVTKGSGKQRYSGGNSIIKPSGSLDLYQGDHANGLSASIARAEVYFERPDGASPLFPGKAEKGSLFNPYWQARLVPVSAAERTLAQLKQGLALP